MEISTYYYYFLETGSHIDIPVTLRARQIMPNKKANQSELIEAFTVSQKTDYTITWLDKYDSDFRQGHDVKICFSSGNFSIRLNWLDRIKIKCIWKEYWLLRDGNFKSYILPFLIAFFTTLVTIAVKELKDKNKSENGQIIILK